MMFNGALTEDRFDQLTQRLATAPLSRRAVIGVIGGVFASRYRANPSYRQDPLSGSTSTGIATRIRCRRRDGNDPAH
jgi:hypothetical protein